MNSYGSYNVEISNTYVMVISVVAMVTISLCLLVSVLCLRHRILSISNHGSQRDDQNPVNGGAAGSGARGIDEATLDSYPKMLFSQKTCTGSSNSGEDGEAEDKKCCSICLSEYGESEVVRLMPECGHMFHMDCVDEWLRLQATCPVCRTSPLPSLKVPAPQLDIVLQA